MSNERIDTLEGQELDTAFAEAFGCKEGQPMRPKNLCEVW